MKAKKLKKLLKDVPDDMEVVVFAGHGQTLMSASEVGYSYVEDIDQYMMEEIIVDDLLDCVNANNFYTKVFVLEAM